MRKRALGLAVAMIVGVVLVSASGARHHEHADGTETRSRTKIDVSTRAAVIHYLRSIHVNPKGAVIQRGLSELRGRSLSRQGLDLCGHQAHGRPDREAGRTEPVRLWNREVRGRAVRGRLPWAEGRWPRVGVHRRRRTRRRASRRRALTQSCTINQPNATGTNKAVVWMDTGKLTGLTQSAAYSASITQGPASPGTSSNWNLACVHQFVSIDGSTTKTNNAKRHGQR